jgi:putative hsdS
MSEFRTYTLEQLCIVGSSKRVHLSDYVQQGVPFYRSKEVIELSSGKNISEQLFISSEKYSEIKSKFPIPQENDILITAVGTIGEILVVKDPNFYFKDGNLIWLRNINFDIIDIDYLYYFFKSDFFQKTIKYNNIGAVQKALTIDFLKTVKITLPSLDNQRKLISVLKSIDKKLKINNQINQELEAIAKTLYDYWFVQFDFPDQNGKPYKSSGGKMIYNPELKREIPEGWGVEKISEFLVLNKDKYNKELNWQKIHYLETSNLIENKIEKLKKLDIKSDKIPSRAKEIVKDRDILYSLVRPNQMHFGFIRNPIQNLVASTGFVLLSCEDNPIYNIFFYLFMTLPNNVRRMIKLSESSTSSYPSIRPEDILNMEIVTPYDFSNYRSLVEYLDKIYYQIDVLYKQNEALIQLRDWLLPMLMNGQVKVER